MGAEKCDQISVIRKKKKKQQGEKSKSDEEQKRSEPRGSVFDPSGVLLLCSPSSCCGPLMKSVLPVERAEACGPHAGK